MILARASALLLVPASSQRTHTHTGEMISMRRRSGGFSRCVAVWEPHMYNAGYGIGIPIVCALNWSVCAWNSKMPHMVTSVRLT